MTRDAHSRDLLGSRDNAALAIRCLAKQHGPIVVAKMAGFATLGEFAAWFRELPGNEQCQGLVDAKRGKKADKKATVPPKTPASPDDQEDAEEPVPEGRDHRGRPIRLLGSTAPKTAPDDEI